MPNSLDKTSPRKLGFIIRSAVAAGLALLLSHFARGASQTWTTGNGLWDLSNAQWSGAVWTQGNDAVFTGTSILTLGATTIQVNSISNQTAGSNVTIGNVTGNGTITLGNASTPNTSIKTGSSTTLTINSNVQLAGSQTWDNGGNNALTVNGNITDLGTSTLTISTVTGENNKTINLNGTNSFAALTMAPVGTGQVVNQNSGSLTLSGALTSNSANSTFNSSTNNSFGSLVVNSGAVNLTGSNTITGGTTLTGGTLAINTDVNLGGTGSSLKFDGGTLQINSTTMNAFGARTITYGAGKTVGLTLASGNNFTFDKALTQGTGGLTKTGLGNLTLNQNNTYTGATSITDGTLTLDYSTNGTKIGNAGGTGALTLNGATLSSTGTQAGAEVIKGLVIGAGSSNLGANPVRSTIGGNSANTFDFSSGTFTRSAGGVIAFATSGGPTIKLAGTAGTMVGAGFATIGDNYLSVDASKIVTAFSAYNNDNFTAANNTNITTTGDAWGGTTINSLRIGAAAPTTTTITGTGTITSGGILVSSAVGSNLSTITGGTLATASNNDLVATLNNAGTLQIDSTLSLGTGRLVKSGTGGGNLKLTAANSISGTVNIYDGTIEFANNSGTTALTGAVVGAGGIIKSGLGILQMSSGSSTYAGPTTLKNGNLEFNNSTATFGNGTGLVTLGDASAANNTVFNFSQVARTFTNAFATAGTGGTNTIQVQGGGQNFAFSGGFTLGNNLTLSTFGGNDSITINTGAIGGTGDLVTNVTTTSAGGVVNTVGTSGTSGGNITLASGVNNIGFITNSGNGGVSNGFGTTISGVIGANVKGVIQNSANSFLTLSNAANAFTNNGTTTTGLTIKSGTVFGSNGGTALGAGAVQLGDTTGTASAVLSTSGTTFANNITVQANAGANTNTLTNQGSASTVLSGLITVNDDVTVASNGTGSVNLSGAAGGSALTGAGAVTITSTTPAATNVTIGGANAGFTGAVKIGSGSLKLGNAASLNSANVVSINAGTGNVLDMNSQNQTIAGLNDISGFTGGSVVNTGTAGKTLTLGGSGTYTFSGVYSGGIAAGTAGTGILTIALTGSGQQTLSGNNLYTGATNVNSGTLTITGTLGNTAVTVGAATLNLNGASAISQNTLTINNAASVVTENTNNALSGTAALTQSAGTVTLSMANNYSGATTLSGGTLNLTGSLTGATAIAVNGGTFAESSTGVIGSAAASITVGGGTATLAGANTYTGTTTLTTGTLNLNSAGALGAGTFTINGGTIDNTSGVAVTSQTNNPAITLGGNFAYSTSAGTTNNNLNVGNGTVTNSGNRTITLNGAGQLTFGGVLTAANAAASNTLTVNNGTGTSATTALNFGGYALSSVPSTAATQDTINGSGNVNITSGVTNGTFAGSSLLYSGTGTLTLSGNNTYTGVTGVGSASGTAGSASKLVLSGDNTAATGAINVGNGATLQLLTNANAAAGSVLTLFANTTLQLRGDVNTTFATAGLGAFTAGATNTFDVGGSSPSTLTLSGALNFSNSNNTNTFNITGTSGYTLGLGAITNGNSTFNVNVASGLNLSLASYQGSSGNNSVINFTGAGTTSVGNLTFGSGRNLGASITGTGLVTFVGTANSLNGGVITVGSGATLQVGNGTTSIGSLGGNVANSGTVIFNPGAANTFTLANTLTGGAVTVLNGTLKTGNNFASTPVVTLGSSTTNGKLDINNSDLTVGGLLVGSGATAANQIVTNSGANQKTLVVDTSTAGSSSFSGVITSTTSNNLVLQKQGAGTFTLNGATASTFTGGVRVYGGTLALNEANVAGAANIVSGSNALSMGLNSSSGGTLSITGGNQTFASLSTTASTTNAITLGSGVTLTITSATQNFGANSFLTLNTSAGGANADTSTIGNAVMLWNTGTAGQVIYSGFTVIDAGGSGFATKNGVNQIIRLIVSSLLPGSGSSSSIDYLVDNNSTGGGTGPGGNNLTVTANEGANSVTVDTSASSGNLNLGTNTFATSGWSFGTSSNTYSINGSVGGGLKSGTAGGSITFNNNNAGLISINAPIINNTSASSVLVNGTGTTALAGTNTYTGATTVNAGGVQISGSSATSGFVLNGSSTALLGGTFSAAPTITTNGTSAVTMAASNSFGNWTINSGTSLNLAGFNATVANSLNGTGTITSSSGTPTLTISNVNGTTIGNLITGSLGLTLIRQNGSSSDTQITNASNTYSGGTIVRGVDGSNVTGTIGAFTFNPAGGLQNLTTINSVRSNASNTLSVGPLGTGTITLDNGQIHWSLGATVANSIAVTANGGILHFDANGGQGTLTGAISGSGYLVLQNGFTARTAFSGSMSSFTGTLGVDTNNVGSVDLSGSATGNAAMSLGFFGTSTTTGGVRWTGAGSQTIQIGEVFTGTGSTTTAGLQGSTTAATTVTYQIGDNTSNTPVFNGVIANGSGNALTSATAITKVGTDTQTFTGASTYTGRTTLAGGTLVLGASAANTTLTTSAIGTGILTFAGGNYDSAIGSAGTLSTNNAQAWNSDFTFIGSQSLNMGSGAVTLGANRQVTVTANTLTEGGAIGGSGFSLTKLGVGTMVFSGTGANTYSGSTIVTAGELDLNKTGVNAVAGDVTVNGGTLKLLQNDQIADLKAVNVSAGTLNFNDLNETVGNMNLSGGTTSFGVGAVNVGTLLDISGGNNTVGSGGILTLAAATSGTGLRFSSAGSPNLFVDGTIILGSDTTGNLPVSVSSTVTSGTATISGGGTLDLRTYLNGSSAPDRTFTVADGSDAVDMSISVVIQDSGSGIGRFVKDGAGSLLLSAQNTYNGDTFIKQGTLIAGTNVPLPGFLGGAGAFGDSPSAVLIGNTAGGSTGDAALVIGGGFEVARDITVQALGTGGTQTATIGGNTAESSTFSGAIALSRNLTVSAVSGGTVNLTGSILNAGGTNTVSISGADATSSVVLNSAFGSDQFAPTAITVIGGTLQLGASDQIGDATAVNVGNGSVATFDLGANTETVGQVTLTSGSIIGSGTATEGVLTGTSYDVRSGSVTANLAGSGVTLTKSTVGTVTLSAANTYSGATTVNGGTLTVNGSINNSAVTVNNGGTLGGSGSSKSVAVAAGGTLSPGNSPGIFTTQTATFAGASTYKVEIDASGTATTGAISAINSNRYDQTVLTGASNGVAETALSLDSTASILDLRVIAGALQASGKASAGTPYLSTGGTGTNIGFDNYYVFNLTDSVDTHTGRFFQATLDGFTYTTIDYVANRFATDNPNGIGTFNIGSQEYAISYVGDYAANSTFGGNDVVITAIPEPQTWVMMISGLGMLLLLQRRRRQTEIEGLEQV